MSRNKAGTVRIISGRWRGRRLPVPDLPGLRPSGDRSRETLFNWLQPYLRGARCADLFAGTGVLGLEAASRGAGSVVLIEKSRRAARALRESLALLAADAAVDVSVIEGDAMAWLAGLETGSLDIVFIDPPFSSGLEGDAIRALHEGGLVSPGGFIYVETARKSAVVAVPAGWDLVREKLMGDVRMQLFKNSG